MTLTSFIKSSTIEITKIKSFLALFMALGVGSVMWLSASSVLAAALTIEPTESLELYPGLIQANRFFAGRTIKISGDLPPNAMVPLRLRGERSRQSRQFKLLVGADRSLTLELPLDLPTDRYELTVSWEKNTLSSFFNLIDLPPAGDRPAARGKVAGESGGVLPTVISSSALNCDTCYLELTLAADSTGQHLALAGVAAQPVWLSHNRGKNWQAARLENLFYGSNANSLVTARGDYLLSALVKYPHPAGPAGRTILTGGLYQLQITKHLTSPTLETPSDFGRNENHLKTNNLKTRTNDETF